MKNKKSAVLAVAIKKIADKMAKVSCGAASAWGMYQTKEPKMHKKA